MALISFVFVCFIFLTVWSIRGRGWVPILTLRHWINLEQHHGIERSALTGGPFTKSQPVHICMACRLVPHSSFLNFSQLTRQSLSWCGFRLMVSYLGEHILFFSVAHAGLSSPQTHSRLKKFWTAEYLTETPEKNLPLYKPFTWSRDLKGQTILTTARGQELVLK